MISNLFKLRIAWQALCCSSQNLNVCVWVCVWKICSIFPHQTKQLELLHIILWEQHAIGACYKMQCFLATMKTFLFETANSNWNPYLTNTMRINKTKTRTQSEGNNISHNKRAQTTFQDWVTAICLWLNTAIKCSMFNVPLKTFNGVLLFFSCLSK